MATKPAINMGDAELLLALLVLRLGGSVEFTGVEMMEIMGGKLEVSHENNAEKDTMTVTVRKVEA